MSLGAGVMVFCYYKEKRKSLVISHGNIAKRKRSGTGNREVHVLKLVVLMQTGFLVTLGKRTSRF